MTTASAPPRGVVHPTEVQQRKLRRVADGIDALDRREPVGALRLGGAGARSVAHLDDERDAVALGDRLAQLAHETGS
jgi:hypothetical protein